MGVPLHLVGVERLAGDVPKTGALKITFDFQKTYVIVIENTQYNGKGIAMAKELFITENQKALEQSDLFFPRAVLSRDELSKINPTDFVDVILDGDDVQLLDQFTSAKKWYLPDGLDFNENLDTMNKSFVGGRVAYETPKQKLPEPEDDCISGDNLSNFSATSPDQDFDDYIQTEIPLDDQIKLLQPLLEGKKVGAGSIAELTNQLIGLCRGHTLFMRDTVTGLYKTAFARKPLIPEHHAKTIFETHFWDKLVIKTTSFSTDKETGEQIKKMKYHEIKSNELDLLWRNIGMYSTFNSRKEFYDNIPEWDGEVRIMSFMKKYFECNTNPNFFLLLMTSIIAKFSPRNDYCPYFFDIVSKSKGIGKSFLCRRLVPSKYVGFLTMATRSKDDFYVNAYDGNNVLVVDDECTWVGKGPGKIDMEQFKTLVTNPQDKFSRKFQDPELHDRSFIIIRTCNDVNQVYATNERRQIIFECHLKEQECRILDLPDEFFQQMLAEAKAYYVKNGVYKLTDSDRIEVKENNLNNYNWETPDNYIILDYIQAVRSNPEKWGVIPTLQKLQTRRWGNHKDYCKFCDERHKTPLQSRAFWRAVSALSELEENAIEILSDQRYELVGYGKSRIFAINPRNAQEARSGLNLEDLEDLPY